MQTIHLPDTICNLDCFDFLKDIESNSIDSIIIDPPYNVLKGHKIETKIDIPKLTKEFFRVLKGEGFYAFFGQMPYILQWYNAANELFNWK